ncbi:MAG: flagellar protein FlgN [Proteobacteria bacterium]|nr:flagellar protein FlgN [Pseudomonadota bacterium]
MMHRIQENLSRQHKGMQLLLVLLEEEFSRLMDRNAKGVTPIELSIQELMRQLANERVCLKAMVKAIDPMAERVRTILPILEEERRTAIEELLQQIDSDEQQCGMQAHKNQQLALALYDQSTNLLNFMHKQISPPENKDAYSAKGRYAKVNNRQPALVRGSF